MSYFDDRTDKDVFNPVHGEGDARRRSYELNDKYAGKDNTPSEENKPPEEDYSLNDDRRVKVLSPGTLVAKRFFRNRLAVVGLTILAVMFIFSFIGGLISPYGQDEVFYRDDIQLKEYAAMSENTEYRYLVADGQEFGTILQAQLTLHMGKDDSFSYKGVTYDVTEEGDSLYSVSSGGRLLAIAYKDIISSSDPSQKFGFNFSFNALKAHANGEAEFTASGKTYTLDEDSVMLNGEEIAYISRFVIQSKVSGTVISKDFKERVQQAVENGETKYTYVNDAGQEREIKLEYNPAKYQWSIKEGTSTRVFDAYSFPDSAHWLGTDKNGMDMLTRLMYGGRVSLMIGFIVVIISAALGVVLGGVDFYPNKKLRSITNVTRTFYDRWDENKYRHYLSLFALEETKKVSQLSSGMRVKYMLALALSHDARLLILDEPTSGLDPVSRDELMELFRGVVQSGERSILFSTHITSDLEKCASHITMIKDGEILRSDTCAGFLAHYRAQLGDETLSLEDILVRVERRNYDGKDFL